MNETLENIANKLIVKENEVLAVIHPNIASVVHDGINFLTKGEELICGPEVIIRRSDEAKAYIVDSADKFSLIPLSTDEVGKPTKNYPNKLAGEMLCGYFGELGYVDMIQQHNSPKLIGIVHIPKRLVHLIGALEGEEGLEKFYKTFCTEKEGNRWKNHRWNLEAHPTEINKKILKGLPIEGEQYYWKIEKTESNIFKDGRPLQEQVNDYYNSIREFITELDNFLYRIRPDALVNDRITPELAKSRFESMNQGNIKYLHKH